MKPDNVNLRKAAKLKLAALYAVTLVLLVVILSAFWGPLPSLPKQALQGKLSNDIIQEHQLLFDVNFLHEQFKRLQQTQQSNASAAEVKAAESDFQKAMDSIERKSFSYSSANKKKLYDILSSFTSAVNMHVPVAATQGTQPNDISVKLQNELASKNNRVTDLEKQLKTNQDIINGLQQDFAYLQKEVKIRDSKIAELEGQVRNSSKSSSVNQQEYAGIQKDLQRKNTRITELEKQLQEKRPAATPTSSKDAEKLKSDNKYLSLALASQFKQTTDLTEINKQLRAEIERLKKR